MPVCSHKHGVVIDSTGRECCGDCGEVLRLASDLQTGFEGTKAEFRVVQTMSSYDTSLSVSSSYLVDSVCNDCQSATGIIFSDELKQRVMDLVDQYRRSLKGRSVVSYENIVRSAIIILLREMNYQFPISKIASRFDSKKTPVLRTLAQMNRVLGIKASLDSVFNLITKYVHDIVSFLRTAGACPITCMGVSENIPDKIIAVSAAIYRICKENDAFDNESDNMSQPLACCVFVLKFGCDYDSKCVPPTVRNCVKYAGFSQSEKCCYRDFNALKNLATLSVVARYGNSKSAALNMERFFLDNMQECTESLSTKTRLQSKINSLTHCLDR